MLAWLGIEDVVVGRIRSDLSQPKNKGLEVSRFAACMPPFLTQPHVL
jgi:hypothetical protein